MKRSAIVLAATVFAILMAGGNAWGQSRMPAEATNYFVAAYRGVKGSADDYHGDFDKIQVIFFEVDANVTGPLYIGINDPGIDAADWGEASWDPGDMTFELYGGTSAYSATSAKRTYFTSVAQAQTGTRLDSFDVLETVSANAAYNSRWVYFNGVDPSQGELIGNKRYFKVVVEAKTGDTQETAGGFAHDYKNLYQVAASTVGSGNPSTVSGVRAFAYSLCLGLDGVQEWDVYPFVPDAIPAYASYPATPATFSVMSQNYDMDHVTLNTGRNGVITGYDRLGANWGVTKSGDNTNAEAIAQGLSVGKTIGSVANTNGTWQFHIYGGNENYGSETGANGTDFWFSADASGTYTSGTASVDVDADAVALKIYSAPYAPAAPDSVSVTPGTATQSIGVAQTLTMQIVDKDGNPVPYSRKVYVTASPTSVVILPDDNVTQTYNSLITTDTNGAATFTVSSAIEQDVTLTLATDGLNGSASFPVPYASAIVYFRATPPPTISSASNLSLTVGETPVLGQITITEKGTNPYAIANGTTLQIRIPAGLNAEFNTGVTPTLTNATNGGYTGTKIYNLTANTNLVYGGTITVSGLQLASTTAASSGRLELQVGGVGNWIADDKVITIAPLIYEWDGSAGSNWFAAANWSSDPVLPPNDGTATIRILESAPTDPTLGAGAVVSVKDLIIDSGATVTLDGDNSTSLTVGTLTNSGTLSLSGNEIVSITAGSGSAGTITYANGGAGTRDLVAMPYYNLTINDTGATYQLTAPLTVNGTVTLTAGTLSGTNPITVYGSWSDGGGTFAAGTSTVTFAGSATASITGGTTFATLTCAVPGKTLKFGTVGTITVGTLNLTGSPTSKVYLRSVTDLTDWNIARTTANVSYVDIKDSNITPINTTAAYSVLTGANNTGWLVTSLKTWLGGSAVWSLGTNWSPAGKPVSGDQVAIPATANNPLADENIVAKDIYIAPGAILDLANRNMNLDGGGVFSNEGKLRLYGGQTLAIGLGAFTNDTDSGMVEYYGTTAGLSLSAGSAYYDLSIAGNGGTWTLAAPLNVARHFTLSDGTLNSATNNITVGGNVNLGGADGFTNPGTLIMNNAGSATLRAGGTTIGSLSITGGAVTLGSALSLSGSVTTAVGTTLDVSISNYGITLGGNWNNGGTFTARAGTVAFTSGAATTHTVAPGASSFYGLSTAATSTADFNANNFTIGGTLTNSGTILLEGTQTVSVAAVSGTNLGNWTYDGGTGGTVYNPTVGTQDYNNLTIAGSGAFAFTDMILDGVLTISGGYLSAAADRTLTLDDLVLTTGATRISITGAGNDLVLNATAGVPVALGNTTAAVDLELTSAELLTIAAASLSINATVAGTVTVQGVDTTGSAHGQLILRSAAAMTFTGTNTFAGGLSAERNPVATISLGGATELIGGNATTISVGRINTGTNNLTITADEIDFTQVALGSITGTAPATLTLRTRRTDQEINVYGADSGLGTTLDLLSTELPAIGNSGFATITIGRDGDTGTVSVGAALNGPFPSLIFEGSDATADLIQVGFNVQNTTAARSISFRAPVLLGGNITTNNGLVEFQRAVAVWDSRAPTVSTTGGALTFQAAATIDGVAAGGNNENLTLNAGAGTLSLGAAIGATEPLYDLTLTSGAALAFPDVTLTNDLTATTTVGGLTDTGELTIGGDSSFTVPAAASIVLNTATNTFTGTLAFSPASGIANITIVDTTGVDVPGVTITGNLSITAGNAITDGGPLSVAGTAAFTTTANNGPITLDAASTFTTSIALNTNGTGDASVTNVTGGIALAASSVGGDLTLEAEAGDITDVGAAVVISVTGDASFTVDGGNDIILNNANNVFGGALSFLPITGTISDITLVDTTAVTLPGLTASGTLSVTSGGLLDQSGIIDANIFTFTNTAGDTNLSTSANVIDYFDAISAAGRTVRIQNTVATSQIAATSITASAVGLTGTAAYTLTNTGNNVGTFAASITGAAALSYRDADAVVIGSVGTTDGVTASGGFTLVAGENVTQSEAINVGTTGNLSVTTRSAGTANISLASATNEAGTISLWARDLASGDAAGSITYLDATGFVVSSARTTTTLNLQGGGAAAHDLAQSGDIAVGTTFTIVAGAGDAIFNTPATNNAFGTVTATSAAALSLSDADGFTMATCDTSGAISATTAAGNITVTGPLTTTDGTGMGITINPAGTIALNYAGTVAATENGDVRFQKAVTLGAATRVDTAPTGVDGGDIWFDSTITGANAAYTLQLDSTGSGTAGAIRLDGGSVSTLANQTYDGPVVVGVNTNFTAQNVDTVTFTSTLGGGATARTIAITTANASFGDNVGGVGNLVTSLSVTAGTTALYGNVTTSGIQNFGGAVTLYDNAVLTAGAGSPAINFGSTIEGTFDLDLSATGTISVTGTVGDTNALDVLRVLSSNGTTFNSSVDAATFTILDGVAATTVAVAGNLTLTSDLIVTGTANAYNVSITGTTNSIAGNTDFANTGSLTLGNATSSATTFTGGAAKAAGNIVFAGGSILTDGANDLDFDTSGTITVNANTAIGGDAAGDTGLITLSAVTISATRTLTLGSATGVENTSYSVTGAVEGTGSILINTAGASGSVTFGGTVGSTAALTALTVTNSHGVAFNDTVRAGTVTLTDTADGQAITFSSALTVTAGGLTAGTTPTTTEYFNVAFNAAALGQTTSITGNVSLQTDASGPMGTISFGNHAADVFFVNGTITSTSTATRSLFGALRTSADAINLGDVTLTGNASIDTTNAGGNTDGAAVTVGDVSGAGFDLDMNCGNGAGDALAAGDITATNLRIVAYGSIGASFAAPLNLTVTAFEARSYNGTIFASNTGSLTLGFAGGPFESLVTGAIQAAGTNAIGIQATDLVIGQSVNGGGALTLRPLAATTTVSIGAGGGAFALDDTDLGNLTNGFTGITLGRNDSDTVGVTTATFSDPVTILGGNTITVNAGTPSLVTSGGSGAGITITATGAGILVNGGIDADGAGIVDLNSGAGFTLADGVAIASDSGAITIDTAGANDLFLNGSVTTAGAGTTTITASRSLIMDADSSVTTANGAIILDADAVAAGSLTLHVVESTGGAQITLRAGAAGTIAEADVTASIITATGLLYINDAAAGSSIGGAGAAALNTTVGSLRIAAAGGVYINETDNLTIGDGTDGISTTQNLGSIDILAGGAVTISNPVATAATIVTTATIDIEADSIAIGANVSAASPSQITLTASTAGITQSAGLVSNGGTLDLSAATNIGAAGAEIATSVAVLRATASSGGIFIAEASALQLGDGTGDISSTNGDIVITTAAGAITTGADITAAGTEVDTTGADIALTAGGSTITLTNNLGAEGTSTFNSPVIHSAGTITVGPVAAGSTAVTFFGNYTGTGGTLVGDITSPTAGPDIVFEGSGVILGTFTHNGDRIVFSGTLATTTFNSNDNELANVRVNKTDDTDTVRLVTSNVTQAGANLTIARGILDLDTNDRYWLSDPGLGAAPTAGAFMGRSGATLSLGGSGTVGQLQCVAFTSEAGHTVANTGTNTIRASGSVAIAGGFTNPANSTLSMIGAPTTLNATPTIGNLTIGAPASVTLAAALSVTGDVAIIAGGVLDVTTADWSITVGGNWTNNTGATGFLCQEGTVTFTNATVLITGTTTWWRFVYEEAGGEVRFSNNPDLHTFTKTFRIFSTGADITLTKLTANGDPGNPPDFATEADRFWDISVLPGASLEMQNVTVYYSNASANPIIAPPTVTILPYTTYFNFKWLSGLTMVYSYTEDSDRDGKIDRIRVQTAANVGNDFSGFTATVDGYTVTGYSRPKSGTNFYILLEEKAVSDTEVIPSWTVVENTTLADEATGTKLARTFSDPVPMVPVDTAQPRINYTLALPGLDRVFLSLSESIYNAGPAISFTTSASAVESASVIGNSGGETEYLLNTAANFTVANLASGTTTVTVSNARDAGVAATDESISNNSLPAPTYPTVYGVYTTYATTASGGQAPPNLPVGAAATHRVSDLLISVPPASATASNYFVWPIWAKDSVITDLSTDDYESLTPEEAASMTIGLVRDFTGTRWLRDQDIILQSRVNATLGTPQALRMHFDANVPNSSLATDAHGPTGLWLPTFSESAFSILVPAPRAGTSSSASTAPVSPLLWNIDIPADDPKIESISTIGFYFTLGAENTTNPLYVARLDVATGAAIPADWYRRIKPFTFVIHDVKKQRSSVTILNNVINSAKGERVRISYQLRKAGPIVIQVFTLDGDLVDVLFRGNRAAGDYVASWDGKNRGGRPVARGMYFVRVVGPEIDEIRKIMVVK